MKYLVPIIIFILMLSACQRKQLIRINRQITPEQVDHTRYQDTSAYNPEIAEPKPSSKEKPTPAQDPQFKTVFLAAKTPAPTPNPERASTLFQQAEEAAKKDNLDDAKAKYLESCQNGYSESCHRYGWHLEQAKLVEQSLPYFVTACQGGILKSCNNLGWLAEKNGRLTEAKAYYSDACKKEHRGACRSLIRVDAKLLKAQKN